jgi:hypothetical protein
MGQMSRRKRVRFRIIIPQTNTIQEKKVDKTV